MMRFEREFSVAAPAACPIVPLSTYPWLSFCPRFSRLIVLPRGGEVAAAVVTAIGRAIGLDVHLDFCEVAICEEGKVRSAGRVPSTPEALKVLAESLLPTDRVVLEVTGSAWGIVGILEPHVAKAIVVSPGDTGITQARAKTDRLDARTLAKLLWAGELDAVWTPHELTRVLRPASGASRAAGPRAAQREERGSRGPDAPARGAPTGV
jgi:Transposase